MIPSYSLRRRSNKSGTDRPVSNNTRRKQGGETIPGSREPSIRVIPSPLRGAFALSRKSHGMPSSSGGQTEASAVCFYLAPSGASTCRSQRASRGGMQVFLTGATGALGRPTTRALVAAGHRVRGVARGPEKADIVRADGGEPIEVSLFDPRALRE